MTMVRLRNEAEYRETVTRLDTFAAIPDGELRHADYEALLAYIDLWEEQHEGLPSPSSDPDRS